MKIPKLNLNFPQWRNLNKKRLILALAIVVALLVVVIFINKIGFTAFTVKEEEKPPACTDECGFEGRICEDAKIFECSIGEDGCKHKTWVEDCPKNAECSTVNKDKCYESQLCDGDFHICVSDFLYRACKNGRTIEDAETKKCPEGLMCNRNPKQFAVCVEKDY